MPETNWLGYLLSGAKSTKVNGAKSAAKGSGKVGDFTTDDAREYVSRHGSGALCRAMRLVLKAEKVKLSGEVVGSRYDHAVEGSMALVRLISEGHRGGAQAISELGAAYADAVADVADRDSKEWPRMVTGAVAAVSAVEVKQHDRGDCPMPAMSEDSDSSIWPSPQEPYAVAQRFAAVFYPDRLVAWRDDFYEWSGTRWEELPITSLRHRLYTELADKTYWGASKDVKTELKWKPDNSKVTKVLDALKAVVHRDDRLEVVDDGLISFSNGVLDPDTRTLVEHSPARFNLTALPYPYSPGGDCTEWLKFLDTLWGDDPDSIALLQEWFGYVISGHVYMQKIAMLVGPPRSGKGTITSTLAKLVGEKNIAAPPLAQLGESFGLATLIGKTLTVISDARFSPVNQVAVIERLLLISGQDPIDVNRKNKEMWNGVLGRARIVIGTNEVPKMKENSGALAKRFVILKMNNTFYGREDHGLQKRIFEQLPGIVDWALDGWDRLREQDFFTRPDASEKEVRMMEELSSPEVSFMRERAVRVEGAVIAKKDLYGAYRMWCDDAGERPASNAVFFRNLASAYPDLRTGQSRFLARGVTGSEHVTGSVTPIRVMWGIELRPPEKE